MREVIKVEPSLKKSVISSVCLAIYTFFAWMGEGVLRCPNKAFYAVLVVMCILAPIFAIILAIGLLCGIYRRGKACHQ